MIIKLMERGEWNLFDGLDRVVYRLVPSDETIGTKPNCLEFAPSQGTKILNSPKCEETRYEITGFRKQTGFDILQIITHGPVYILNDEGKTIERL